MKPIVLLLKMYGVGRSIRPLVHSPLGMNFFSRSGGSVGGSISGVPSISSDHSLMEFVDFPGLAIRSMKAYCLASRNRCEFSGSNEISRERFSRQALKSATTTAVLGAVTAIAAVMMCQFVDNHVRTES